jgi:hypothetical protein
MTSVLAESIVCLYTVNIMPFDGIEKDWEPEPHRRSMPVRSMPFIERVVSFASGAAICVAGFVGGANVISGIALSGLTTIVIGVAAGAIQNGGSAPIDKFKPVFFAWGMASVAATFCFSAALAQNPRSASINPAASPTSLTQKVASCPPNITLRGQKFTLPPSCSLIP